MTSKEGSWEGAGTRLTCRGASLGEGILKGDSRPSGQERTCIRRDHHRSMAEGEAHLMVPEIQKSYDMHGHRQAQWDLKNRKRSFPSGLNNKKKFWLFRFQGWWASFVPAWPGITANGREVGPRLNLYTYLVAAKKGNCKSSLSIPCFSETVAGDVAWYLEDLESLCSHTGWHHWRKVCLFSSSLLSVCDLSSFPSCVISDRLLHFYELSFLTYKLRITKYLLKDCCED